MGEQKSFITRVKEDAIGYASQYKNYFVDYEYLLCSEAFTRSDYYIIQSHPDNYKHLLGVSSPLSAEMFFSKCQDGTLSETECLFIKRNQSESEVKGAVRRKLKVLPLIMDVFSDGTLVEEDFCKNRIRCSVAVGKSEFTLGFTVSVPAKPMTLLKGNQLNKGNSKPLELVLRRRRGADKFDELIVGNEEQLRKYYHLIQELLSDRLLETGTLDENQKHEIRREAG